MSFFDLTGHSPTTDPAPRRCRAIDFGAKRAGRAVVNLHLEQAFGGGKMVVHYPIEMRVVDSMPQYFVIGYGHTAKDVLDDPWDLDAAALLGGGVPVDTGLVKAAKDPDEAILAWFADQQTATEQTGQASGSPASDDLESNEEAILTRPSGSRSRRSWRGGGSMYRR
jgi:hypothetical protein